MPCRLRIYEGCSGNPASNVRVQIYSFKVWYLSKTKLDWVKLIDTQQGLTGEAEM
jgi:hypothetical protein